MLIAAILTSVLTGCKKEKINTGIESKPQINNLDFNFSVDPETLALEVESNGITEKLSEPLGKMKVSNLKDSGDNISWTYSEQGIKVDIEKKISMLM